MNAFKRFVQIVFSIAGLLALLALILPWTGPFTSWATSMMSAPWYFTTICVLSTIAAIGLLVLLVRALVVRDTKSVVIDQLDGGQITVSRDAIASQATHIVETDGSCKADHVNIKTRKGLVDVSMRVHPKSSLDIVEKGAQLRDALTTGLAAVCGNKVGTINLAFVQPENITDAEPVATYTALAQDNYITDNSNDVALAEATLAPEGTGDITVPMGATHDFPALSVDNTELTPKE